MARQGIWEALLPERRAKFERFIEEYEKVRRMEGRGSGGGHYYLALPFKDVSGHNSWQWKIRGRSFRFLAQKVLPILEYRITGGMDVLDLGAGNCWLSYRLASRGHRPVAVDLLVNQLDGLGAARHYFPFLGRKFPRFQAEIDRLPFAEKQFDLAIFNASFHYSEDYSQTLEECLRCLRRPGHIIIMDSPLYTHAESGERMLQERRSNFERKYGFRSDSVASREYLTPSMLDALGRRFDINWTILHPWYGVKWAVRPLRAWFQRRREPAKFQIIWGTVD
ncbi:MAG: class I SAM-dependent methyltransferase [Deltaproteobacteria bacterium]